MTETLDERIPMPNDTIPPPPAPPTEPTLPVVIRAGQAQMAMMLATANVARAIGELEATANAIARALDETVDPLPVEAP
jgi:hypothetical protein